MSLNLLYLFWFGDRDCFCFLIISGRIDKRDVIPTVFPGTLLIVLIVLSCSFTLGVVDSHLLWLTFYHDQLWRRDSYWVDESHFIFFLLLTIWAIGRSRVWDHDFLVFWFTRIILLSWALHLFYASVLQYDKSFLVSLQPVSFRDSIYTSGKNCVSLELLSRLLVVALDGKLFSLIAEHIFFVCFTLKTPHSLLPLNRLLESLECLICFNLPFSSIRPFFSIKFSDNISSLDLF